MSSPSQDVFTSVVDRIWSGDSAEMQKLMLAHFANNMRKCSLDLLLKYRAFFVPNNSFMFDMSDGELANPVHDIYRYEQCMFSRRLVIPLSGFNGKIHGFVGYDNGEEVPDSERTLHSYYMYQNEGVFKKDRNWFMTVDEYLKAIELNYVCIVDGIFDKIAVSAEGHPAVSILGSNLSYYHSEYLRFVKYWIVLGDNDDAGYELYMRALRYNPNTVRVLFADGCKDIDDRINKRTDGIIKLNNCIERMRREGFLISENLECS